MSVFVIVPFMEFALPFALKIWPNMLPSTFQDSLKEEENMKNELKTRIAMAEFFQETLQDLAKEQKKAAANRKKALKQENDNDSSATTQPSSDLLKLTETREESASSFLEFIEKARQGEMIPP
jgi:LETM1 and EF-hand domain-containing protein 1